MINKRVKLNTINKRAASVKSSSTTLLNIDKNFSGTMLGLLAVTFALYLIFMGQTILNIIERKNFEASSRSLSSEISSLEIEYINLSKSVDYSLAESLGFKDSKNTHYASRTKATASAVGSNEL